MRKKIDSLVNSVKVVSEDIGVSFGIEKCADFAMKRGKEAQCNGIDLANGFSTEKVD